MILPYKVQNRQVFREVFWGDKAILKSMELITIQIRIEFNGKGHCSELSQKQKWVSDSRVMKNESESHSVVSEWSSPGQNTGVGSLSLLQGIFPTQGLNLVETWHWMQTT